MNATGGADGGPGVDGGPGPAGGLEERVPDVAALRAALDATGYLADEALATALFLAARMGQPILLEGEPGVGKTEAAKALAQALATPLLRLQCYEGLTSSEALYEWNYPRQLLAIRLAEARGETLHDADLFSEEYLLARPLLAALDHPGPPPGRAADRRGGPRRRRVRGVPVRVARRGGGHHPRTRHQAGQVPPGRRAHLEPDPGPARRAETALPLPLDRLPRHRAASRRSSAAGCPSPRRSWPAQVARGVARLRDLDLAKPPGVAEAISWAGALNVLGADQPRQRDRGPDGRRGAQVLRGPAGRPGHRVRGHGRCR